MTKRAYFSYDREDGIEFHETESEARERAEGCMEEWREAAADDEWYDEAMYTCYGKVLGVATETRVYDAPEDSRFEYMREVEIQDPAGGTEGS